MTLKTGCEPRWCGGLRKGSWFTPVLGACVMNFVQCWGLKYGVPDNAFALYSIFYRLKPCRRICDFMSRGLISKPCQRGENSRHNLLVQNTRFYNIWGSGSPVPLLDSQLCNQNNQENCSIRILILIIDKYYLI